MQCGWIPKAERPDDLSGLLEAEGSSASPVNTRAIGVCPGYLVRLRGVVESAQARAAMGHHVLPLYFPGEEAALLDGAMAAEQAFNLCEIERMKKEARRG